MRIPLERAQVLHAPRHEVVETIYGVAFGQEAGAQMRAQKSGAACHDRARPAIQLHDCRFSWAERRSARRCPTATRYSQSDFTTSQPTRRPAGKPTNPANIATPPSAARGNGFSFTFVSTPIRPEPSVRRRLADPFS